MPLLSVYVTISLLHDDVVCFCASIFQFGLAGLNNNSGFNWIESNLRWRNLQFVGQQQQKSPSTANAKEKNGTKNKNKQKNVYQFIEWQIYQFVCKW